jgi:hypothetical protein
MAMRGVENSHQDRRKLVQFTVHQLGSLHLTRLYTKRRSLRERHLIQMMISSQAVAKVHCGMNTS